MYSIVYPKHPMDAVEINGRTPPLVWVDERGQCDPIPVPKSVDLGRFGEHSEGAVLWIAAGYIRIKHVSQVVSRPMGFQPTAFAWVEWFVGPPNR